MKSRTVLVSYANCQIAAYQVRHAENGTEIRSAGNPFAPEEKGAVVARVIDSGNEGLSITIPNGAENSTIRLSAAETERLLVALLAHQRLQEGFDLQLFRKE